MAEESGQVDTKSGQDGAASTAEASPSEGIESRLAALGSFMSKEDADALRGLSPNETKGEQGAQGEQKEQGEEPAAEGQEGKGGEDKVPDGDEKKSPTAGEESKKPASEETKKSVLGLNKKAENNKTDLVIDSPEQILPVVEKSFGMKLNDIKEMPKFFDKAQGWRTQAQKFEATHKELTQLKSEVENLPEEFFDAFRLIAEGKDYREAFVSNGAPKIDFKVAAEKHDAKTLVNYYFPGKFTDDDFKEESKSPNLEFVIPLALEKYNLDKKGYDSKRAQYAESESKRIAAYSSSVEGSVSGLMQAFPETDTDVITEIKSILEGGPQKIMSHFVNDDGTVKPEAAKRLIMAMYGEAEIEAAMERAAHISETRVNEELLSRGADSPRPAQPKGTPEVVSEEMKKKVAEIERVGQAKNKRTF